MAAVGLEGPRQGHVGARHRAGPPRHLPRQEQPRHGGVRRGAHGALAHPAAGGNCTCMWPTPLPDWRLHRGAPDPFPPHHLTMPPPHRSFTHRPTAPPIYQSAPPCTPPHHSFTHRPTMPPPHLHVPTPRTPTAPPPHSCTQPPHRPTAPSMYPPHRPTTACPPGDRGGQRGQRHGHGLHAPRAAAAGRRAHHHRLHRPRTGRAHAVRAPPTSEPCS